MKTWTVAAQHRPGPRWEYGSQLCRLSPAINKHLPVVPVVRWFCPPWESLTLAGLRYRKKHVGEVQTPLSQPGQVFVIWKLHDNRRVAAMTGLTSILDDFWVGGGRGTPLCSSCRHGGSCAPESCSSRDNQDAASSRWASVPFSVKWGESWFSSCRPEVKIK